METKKRTLIFWFNQPPKVELGAYNYLSKYMESDTYYVCEHDLPAERKKLGWDNINYGNAKMIILPSSINEKKRVINNILDLSNESIHIVCGLSGSIADIVCPILKKRKIKFCVVSERPRIVFDSNRDKLRSIGLYLKYFLKFRQYNKNVIALLALGKKGVYQYKKIGWSMKKLFHFMYCGEYSDFKNSIKNKEKKSDKIKFLYIGRFSYIHGLDILTNAFDMINSDNWTLDMAGGYGKDADVIMEWINNKDNVNFIGKIEYSKVREKMMEYDVILVPSRMDGWNCQINEALSVNVPVITNDEAVSSELISESGAGINVKSLSAKELADAIKYSIDNRTIVKEWSKKASDYSNYISEKTVGEYLYSILSYVYDNIGEKPICPWINVKNEE